jgi:hypothetical protein
VHPVFFFCENLMNEATARWNDAFFPAAARIFSNFLLHFFDAHEVLGDSEKVHRLQRKKFTKF